MNDKDRELLAQILHSGGAAAQKGFEELVQWCFVDALANVICYLGVAGLGVFAMIRLLSWRPKKETHDADLKYICRGAALLICLVVLAICTGSWLPGNMRELLAPQGEAVAYVLSHH